MSGEDATDGLSGDDMTLDELEEALEDEGHPRHAEARRVNDKLAEQLRPALDRFRDTMRERSGLNDSSARLAGLTKGNLGAGLAQCTSTPSAPDLWGPRPPLVAEQTQRSFERQSEQLKQASRAMHEERARRRDFEDERAARTQDVFEAMNANLMRLNSQMSQVDARLVAGNASSDEVGSKTLRVAQWTLIATFVSLLVAIIGVGVAVWLSR